MDFVKLTDVCRPKQWKTISGKDLLTEGYPVYGANGIIGYWSDYNHSSETVTIACRGTCGTVNIVPAKSYINGNAMSLDNLSDTVNLRFLYYYLRGYDFKEIITGTTIPQITIEGLRKVLIPRLSLENQVELVHLFDIVQNVIDARQKEIQLLDDLIKARFVEMFGDQNYMVRSLADVIVPGAGLSYGIIVPGDYYENGCPMVRPSDFKNNKLDLTNVYRVDPAIEKQYARTRLQGDEILVQVIGQPGQIIPATEECKGMNVTRNLAVVRPNNRLVNRQYLIEYLRSETAQRYLTGSSKQSTLKQLPLSLLKTLEVPIPPMELQAQFSFVVSQIDKTKSVIQKSLDETQLLFDGLMQKYFGYEDEEGHPNG